MNLGELIADVREEIDDTEVPPRVSDDILKRFANDAVNQACRRGRLIIDSSTAAICDIAFLSAAQTVSLNARIVFVRRVKLAGRSVPLKRITQRDIDRMRPGWETDTGEPTHYIPDFETNKLRLYPIPTTSGTLHLTVVRLPVADMDDDNDTPEIRADLHHSLKHWMRRCFYLLPDTEGFDPKAAQAAEAEFALEFGPRPSAQDEAWINREYDQDGEDGVY